MASMKLTARQLRTLIKEVVDDYHGMTVGELIEKLSQFPPDAVMVTEEGDYFEADFTHVHAGSEEETYVTSDRKGHTDVVEVRTR